MKDVSEEHPVLVKDARKNVLPKAGQSIGLVDLVAVHAKNPGCVSPRRAG